MSIIDQMAARIAGDAPILTPAQQQRLTDWENTDQTWSARQWTPEERQECTEWIVKNPDFTSTSADVAKFGSVDSLFSRYEGLLRRCEQQGLLTPIQVKESAEMARSGRISLGSVIQEGKALKSWLEEAQLFAEVAAAFAPKKVLEPA